MVMNVFGMKLLMNQAVQSLVTLMSDIWEVQMRIAAIAAKSQEVQALLQALQSVSTPLTGKIEMVMDVIGMKQMMNQAVQSLVGDILLATWEVLETIAAIANFIKRFQRFIQQKV